MKNLKDDFMNDERHERIEGMFVVCLTTGINFIAKTAWRIKTSDRDHFRFYQEGQGEHRIEPEKVEAIIKINSPRDKGANV